MALHDQFLLRANGVSHANSSTVSSFSSVAFILHEIISILSSKTIASPYLVLPSSAPITRCCLALWSLRHDFHGFRASLILSFYALSHRVVTACRASSTGPPGAIPDAVPFRELCSWYGIRIYAFANLHNKALVSQPSRYSFDQRIFYRHSSQLSIRDLQCAETRSLCAHMDLCTFLNICQTSSTRERFRLSTFPHLIQRVCTVLSLVGSFETSRLPWLENFSIACNAAYLNKVVNNLPAKPSVVPVGASIAMPLYCHRYHRENLHPYSPSKISLNCTPPVLSNVLLSTFIVTVFASMP